MGLLRDAVAATDQADLILLSNVETICDQEQPATASAVASLIGGAPAGDVHKRMLRLVALHTLEINRSDNRAMQLTELGAELLRAELEGWSPSKREDRRRYSQLLSATANPYALG